MLKLGSDFGTRFERSDIRTPNDIPSVNNQKFKIFVAIIKKKNLVFDSIKGRQLYSFKYILLIEDNLVLQFSFTNNYFQRCFGHFGTFELFYKVRH